MKKNILTTVIINFNTMKTLKPSGLVLLLFSFFLSCDNEDLKEKLSTGDTNAVSEEALTDYFFQDLNDMGSVAIASPTHNQYSGGRTNATITIQDHRFLCDGITITIEPGQNSTAENPNGVLTVNFGTTGCSDAAGNIRKGKLIFTYSGNRFTPGASVTTVPENYFINNIKIEGVHTSTNVATSTEAAPKVRAVLTNGKATFSDGTVAERTSDIIWSWIRAENPLNDKLIVDISSTANGITREGTQYAVSLVEALEYKRLCSLATKGVKKYVIDGNKEFYVDYGDGGCDKIFTLKYNGVERVISL